MASVKKDNNLNFVLKINLNELALKYHFQFDEIKIDNSQEISFYDENKKKVYCFVSKIDQTKIDEYHCFWCTLPLKDYTKTFISIPTRYISEQKKIQQKSSLNGKDVFTIHENVFTGNDYYESEGIFCSFNCCKSYILDNKAYNQTLSLSFLNDIWQSNNSEELLPAPHWQTLKIYGGKYSTEEFRKLLNSVELVNYGKISLYSIGNLFTEKKKIPNFNN